MINRINKYLILRFGLLKNLINKKIKKKDISKIKIVLIINFH